MIIVKLIGGLGNQMFQYALGFKLANIHHVPFKLDLSEFQNYNLRRYRLDNLSISGEIATSEEIRSLKKDHNNNYRNSIFHTIERIKPYYRRKYIKEKTFTYDPNILKAPSDVYLDGYWQSEKYFKDIKSQLLREFRIKNEPDELNKSFLEKIQEEESICVHIRRGDYISNPETNQFHGICDIDYYNNAMKELLKHIFKPCFYFFSDDIEWVKTNLKINYPAIYISNNGPDKEYEDLRLMAACKHYIIANSSFSWWAAWLSQNRKKTIIAPKRWFNQSIDTSDLVPESWIKM
jgi:hypothetical protein